MEQSWLFRQGELILGPVAENQVVQKIYAGELDGKSEVQPMGDGRFRRLADVETFRVHLAKADAKKRVDAQAAAHAQGQRRSRNRNIVITIVSLVVIGGAVVAAGSYLAIHTPGKSTEELAFGDLISVEAPTITAAHRAASNEEMVEVTGINHPGQTGTTTPRPNRPKTTNTGSGKVNDEGANDPDGMSTAKFDQGAINGVVKNYQKTLFTCLKQVNKPGVVQTIPIEFVIGANGKVTKVWVDNPDYKTGMLPDCLLEQLQKWPFKSFEGESPTVSLKFNVGKAG